MSQPGEFQAEREWLEADGLGGFASGTVTGIRTRRYHGWLMVARRPPADRAMLMNGVEAWVEGSWGRLALSSQEYASGAIHPDGMNRLDGFEYEPWPTWTYRMSSGGTIRHEIFVPHGSPAVTSRWSAHGIDEPAQLYVRPLLSGRFMHALQREHSGPTGLRVLGRYVEWKLPDMPAIRLLTNGDYEHQPDWYRDFLYREERARGLDHLEDLSSPGVLSWDLCKEPAVMIVEAATLDGSPRRTTNAVRAYDRLRSAELKRRQAFSQPMLQAADAYIVARGKGKTIIAGYPWFGDWGRDTFIALRGLCLATGRLGDAGQILEAWTEAVDGGMLPNRFPDGGEEPEFNSVDASLWFAIAAAEYLALAKEAGHLSRRTESRLVEAVHAIIRGYREGTRYGIRLDDDALIACGEPGVQLTWMDAKVGDCVITPRIGKPVEVQALWLNTLALFRDRYDECATLFSAGLASFRRRFVDAERRMLFDVVDDNHQPGAIDRQCRPNQIFAVGGLPITLVSEQLARRVVDAVEASLWTPMGLRSLAPDEPSYVAQYAGGPPERDVAYHQGTVWPWLVGPFIEAWTKARRWTAQSRSMARKRFLAPLYAHLKDAGLGHVSELADAEHPHAPRGAPCQAWSLAEIIRLDRLLSDARPPSP